MKVNTARSQETCSASSSTNGVHLFVRLTAGLPGFVSWSLNNSLADRTEMSSGRVLSGIEFNHVKTTSSRFSLTG